MIITGNLKNAAFVTTLFVPLVALAQNPSGPADFGDLPNPGTPGAPITYKTKIADGGPWHLIDSQIFLGTLIDNDGDGFPSATADGDDLSGGPDDEDGVTPPATIKAGTSVTFQVKVTNQKTAPAYLHAFIDWNGDGAFIGGLESNVITIPSGTIGVTIPVSFNVPTTAITTTDTGARFRLSTLAVDPNDPAPDGEVEDLMITISPPDLDFGDLPDSSVGASPAYPTTLADNGARHAINTALFLGGSAPDIEADGQPHASALGDDTAGSDDEEDFGPLTAIQAGTTVAFSHKATNQLTNDAWLHGFFDWNHDGDFLDTNEYQKLKIPSGSASLAVALNVPVPTGLAYTTDIPARLRFTSLEFIAPTGLAPDGEVEDYLLTVLPALDFGDLPDTSSGTTAGDFISAIPDFQTTLADNGPRHLITPDLVFLNDTGSGDADVDAETDAHQSPDATGDDSTGDNDELELLHLVSNLSVTSGGAPDCSDVEIDLEITLNHAFKNDLAVDATLHTFIDWNHDGDFLDTNESWSQIIAAGTTGNVNVVVSNIFPWQGLTSWTEIWAVRSRLTTDPSVTATGYAPNGEVQDDLVTINLTIADPCPIVEPTMDFGDLPDSCHGSSAGNFDTGTTLPDYRTRLVDNGPRHLVTPNLTIENDSTSTDSNVDAELDGQPTATADGDDTDGNNDDLNLLTAIISQSFNAASPIEHSTLTLVIGTSQAVRNVTGNNATFYGFIDGNRDGDFDDPGEKLTLIIPGDDSVPSVSMSFTVTIPWTGELTWTETFALRFRISSDSTLDANGEAPDGEVQDHLFSANLTISDPRPTGSTPPHILNFDPIAATTAADLTLDPAPFLPSEIGPIHDIKWSLNGTFLSGNPPVITAQDLAELGQGAIPLTLTFLDDSDKLYRVNPWINLRDWPEFDSWAQNQGLNGQDTLPDIDLDEDGFSSRLEFAFGSDPLDPSSIPTRRLGTRTSDGDTWLIQSYLRRDGGLVKFGGSYEADGIHYSGESSADIADWTTPAIPTFNPLSLPAPPAGYIWATHRYPDPISSQIKAFLRAKADCQ
ncbi:MAG: GEVED domain-containing protein [Verrucomicrobiaceae bacterium]